MASKNNINTFYFKLFYATPNPVEYANFKSVVNNHLKEFCEMVANDYRNYSEYEKWQNRYYEQIGHKTQIERPTHYQSYDSFYNTHDNNIFYLKDGIDKDSSKVDKIKYFFLKYDKQILSEEELEEKLKIFHNGRLNILDEVLFNEDEQFNEQFINGLLQLK